MTISLPALDTALNDVDRRFAANPRDWLELAKEVKILKREAELLRREAKTYEDVNRAQARYRRAAYLLASMAKEASDEFGITVRPSDL